MIERNDGDAAANSVCAVVVTYFPDDDLDERIRRLLPQLPRVVIVDNTSDENAAFRLKSGFENITQVHLIQNHANKGISVALNQGLKYAKSKGYRWILSLDQDTQWYPDVVDTLLRVADGCTLNPMVIGGNYLDLQNHKTKVPSGGNADFLEQKTVITSGCLVDANLASTIGGFREDYFIDQVDHEFCLRARAHGHKVVISRKPVMKHSVGRTGGVRIPFLGVMPNHPSLRKYYIARNTVVTVAEYWRREPDWCARRLVRLLLGLGLMAVLEEHRFNKVRAFAAGVADGVRRRMGPCRRKGTLDK